MKDLLTQLDNILAEGSISPGDRKAISFRIKKLEKMKEKVEGYQRSLRSIKNASVPDELRKEQDSLSDKMAEFLVKIEAEYNELSKKFEGQGDQPIKLETLLKGIKKNCSQILKIYQQVNNKDLSSDNFIFRGISSYEDALYGMPFESRKPKDSNRVMDELADNYMKRMGFEARRTNSIFTSGDRSQASSYGNSVYVIFPVDGFHFTYSKKIRDLVLRAGDYLHVFVNTTARDNIRKLVKEAFINAEEGSKIKHKFGSIYAVDDLLGGDYEHTGDIAKLKDLVESGDLPKEVETLIGELYNEDDKPKQKFDFSDNDIYGAILSEHEIYINSKYYAIKLDYLKQIRKFIAELDLSDVEVPERYGESPTDLVFVNDIVKIIKGEHKDKIAVVYTTSGKTANLKTSYDSGYIYNVPFDDLEVLDPSEKIEWKEDDEVIPTSPDTPFRGYTGTVVSVSDNEPSVYVKLGEPFHKTRHFYNFELVKSTPETQKEYEDKKFKIYSNGERVVIIDENNPFYQLTGTVSYAYSGFQNYDVNIDKSGRTPSFNSNQMGLESENQDKIKEPIGVGDTVLMKREGYDYDGKVGEVVSIYGDGEAVVKIPNYGNEYLELRYLTLQKEEQPNNTNLVREGGVVRIISHPDGYVGQIGVIVSKDGNNLTIKLPLGTFIEAKVSYVEPYQVTDKEGTPIDIEDIVTTTSSKITLEPDDGELTVMSFDYTDNGTLYVTLFAESGKDFKAFPGELIVVSPKLFNKGDKVRIISGSLSGTEAVVSGKTASFIKVITSQGEFKYFENELEPIKSSAKDEEDQVVSFSSFNPVKFKEGDKVKLVVAKDNWDIGTEGTITYISSYTGNMDIREKNTGHNIVVPEASYLQKINDFSNDADEKKFQIDDKVKVIDPAHEYYGKEGDIDYIWKDGQIDVHEKDTKVEFYVTKDQIEKIDSYTNTTKKEQKFQIGDTVKVIYPGTMYVNKVGKVVNVSKVSGAFGYGIKIDGSNNITSFDEDELDLVKEKTNSLFEEGDIVEINESPLVANGTLGLVIVEGDTTGVKILEGPMFEQEYTIDAGQLTKIPDYEVGERVEVINQKLSSYGKIGDIEKLGTAMLHVNMIDTTPPGIKLIKRTSVKRVPKVASEPHSSGLSAGDTVKITDPTSGTLDGEIGVVQFVGNFYADVVVPPNGPEHPYTIELTKLVKVDAPQQSTTGKIETDDIVEVVSSKYPQYAGKKYKVVFISDDYETVLLHDLSDSPENSIAVSTADVKKVS